MDNQNNIINSVNLNQHTDFPYLVLNVKNDVSYPMNPGFRVMHWHEDLQFIYVIRGTICVKTLEEEEILSAGEGIFINKNVVHTVEKIETCEYKSFLFPEYFVSFYIGSPAMKLTQGITDNKGISLVVLYGRREWCGKALAILKELVQIEESDKDRLYSYEVLNRLTSLWLVVLQNVSVSETMPENATSSRTRMFLQYIETHYAEDITLEELAKSAGVSKSECLRCFKATLQTTPYKYLMDFRLSKAEKLLKDTDLPICEIAIRTGFNGQSYFGKCFREKMNCSPSEYKRSQLTESLY